MNNKANKKPNKAQHVAPSLIASRKSVSQSQRDISDMKLARQQAQLEKDPKFYLLQNLYNTITEDALLSSQLNNRIDNSLSAPFEIVNDNNEVDDELTKLLQSIPATQTIMRAIVESKFYGYSLVEFYSNNGTPTANIIKRQNVDPVFGRFYPDYLGAKFVPYRDTAEFGSWILDFCDNSLGLLNKTIPHVLFKKFAQSCWSELCEIYGIPPRYIKTNTQDPAMLQRAEDMLRDMGAAAAFVIDETEEFNFAQGSSTNGDVYNNLIRLCNNEISLIISGAIIGQDTENGNYSKELASIDMLDRLIQSDKRLVEFTFNNKVLPALAKIGWIPENFGQFRFTAVEDSDKTWELVKGLLPYKDIDNKWIEEKFGIPVSDKSFGTEPDEQPSDKQLDFFV